VALFTAEYAVAGAAEVPLHTVAVSTIRVHALGAVFEGWSLRWWWGAGAARTALHADLMPVVHG
jgi:hypothetical protein